MTVTCALGATTAYAQPHGRARHGADPVAWTSESFDSLDQNTDGRVSRREWRSEYGSFDAIDVNHDGFVSRREFLANDEGTRGASNRATQATSSDRVEGRDQSARDTSRAYEVGRQRGLDEGRRAGLEDGRRGRWDLDGQQELEGANSGYRQELGALDEYQAGYREGFMTGYREGFGPNAPRHGAAYREGQARGLSEGHEAGREDAQRNHWDLEGQRELVLADSGYRAELGSRSEYEEGYRAGFRQGYSEGFGRR
jgi:flagellar biosynthesis/type III secretory pathway protein FliH